MLIEIQSLLDLLYDNEFEKIDLHSVTPPLYASILKSRRRSLKDGKTLAQRNNQAIISIYNLDSFGLFIVRVAYVGFPITVRILSILCFSIPSVFLIIFTVFIALTDIDSYMHLKFRFLTIIVCLVVLKKLKLLPRFLSFFFIIFCHFFYQARYFCHHYIPNNYNTTNFFRDTMFYSNEPPSVFECLVKTAAKSTRYSIFFL